MAFPATNADDGSLLVGSFEGSRVFRYNATTGEFIDEFVPEGSGGLNGACCLAFGPDGNLYVGDIPTNSILRYDWITGDFIDAFVPTGGGGLFGPRMLVFKEKISMCHRPPGNSGRARTVDVGHLSAADHAAHGDSVGP
jgi:WD40 repeat protein